MFTKTVVFNFKEFVWPTIMSPKNTNRHNNDADIEHIKKLSLIVQTPRIFNQNSQANFIRTRKHPGFKI